MLPVFFKRFRLPTSSRVIEKRSNAHLLPGLCCTIAGRRTSSRGCLSIKERQCPPPPGHCRFFFPGPQHRSAPRKKAIDVGRQGKIGVKWHLYCALRQTLPQRWNGAYIPRAADQVMASIAPPPYDCEQYLIRSCLCYRCPPTPKMTVTRIA